jgi:hypothetical protein
MMQQAKQESAIEKIGREMMQKEKQERAMQKNGLEMGSNRLLFAFPSSHSLESCLP